MPGERRSEQEIRREIASEREQLADAIADLRKGIDGKRRVAAVVGGVTAAAFAAAAVLTFARRLRDG